MSITSVIQSLDFFSSLNKEQISTLAEVSSVNYYNKDYVLHYEKKESYQLLFLIDGLARAYKIDKYSNEIFLYYIYKNSLLSEVSNVRSDVLSSFSNIVLVEDSKILSVNYAKFQDFFLNRNLLNTEFTNEIIARSQQLQALVYREFIFDAVAKVAMTLYKDLNMFNALKRHDISLILHIQPATLSRVLNRLKRNKIIDISHGEVQIVNSLALKAIYED
ncbi:MAG: Crp/Fnr family transcriptional regulator [Sulfurimonas sp.]|nr:Crp/Fnr family transcriptional regulator [Sulfurimonas sp.]MDD5202308.1 Crp/Fnr family transcriptional regulator [Sulfurimonas sp.]